MELLASLRGTCQLGHTIVSAQKAFTFRKTLGQISRSETLGYSSSHLPYHKVYNYKKYSQVENRREGGHWGDLAVDG